MKNLKNYSIITAAITYSAILVFAGYQHGKFVGQLGGKYDSAAYESLITGLADQPQAANNKQNIYAASDFIDMPVKR